MGRVGGLAGALGVDAFYVALAEAFDATLLTMDQRLDRARGPVCRIDVLQGAKAAWAWDGWRSAPPSRESDRPPT